MWSDLRDRLDIKKPIDEGELAGMTAACAAFEKAAKFLLPESYKSFITTLGAGEIGGYMRIHAPAPAAPSGGNLPEIASLQDLTEGLQKLAGMESDKGRKAELSSLVGFATSLGGDIFGWRRNGPDTTGEPPIMLVYDDRKKIVMVAESFAEFIERGCLGTESRAWFNDPDYEPTNEFFPMRTRVARKVPKRRKTS